MIKNLCLSIAGSDSGGEAGIQADLQTFADFKCHGLSVITAVTAQNPSKILSLNPLPAQFIADQIQALTSYFEIKYIKTGLLPSVEIMEAILNNIPEDAILICDPIICSTSGTQIMPPNVLQYFIKHFSQRIDFLTPNMEELNLLGNFTENESLINKCLTISKFFRKGLYIKGGHTTSPEIDHFYFNNELFKLSSPLLKLKSSHGTGCRLSSAFCASLTLGESPPKAAINAKNYVHHALRSCQINKQGQWLIGSPGNFNSLQQSVSAEKIYE